MSTHTTVVGIVCITAGALTLPAAVSFGILAAEAPSEPASACQQALRAGRDKSAAVGVAYGDVVDFAGARREFRRALGLAATDQEKAEALLGIGRASLSDVRETDSAEGLAAIRTSYLSVLALPALTSEQRAEAHLGIAEADLASKEYGAAREACARAGAAAGDPRRAARAQMLLARTYLQQRDYAAARREFTRLLAMEGLEEQLRWEAEALLGGISLLPRLRAGHPRLFFTPETWPAAKERALTVERAHFEAMKARVDALAPEEIGSENRGQQAMDAAFVYRVTRDPVVLSKAVRMLRATVAVFPERRLHGSERGYPRIAWLAALDWLWNDLLPAERQSLVNAMLRYAWTRYTECKAHGRLAQAPVYYWADMYWYAGLTLFDPAADDVARARALSLLGVGWRHRQDDLGLAEVPPGRPGPPGYRKLLTGGDDGAWHLNLDYSFAELLNPISPFLYSWQSALGGEIPKEWLNIGAPPDFALRMAVGFGPGHLKYFNYAGSSGGVWGFGQVHSDLLYDYLGHFVHLFGRDHPEHAAIARHLRRRMVDEGAGPSAGQYPALRFLTTDLDETSPPALPAGLPVARHFENVGLVLMSSGFGAGDTYALFAAGGGVTASHDKDAIHFAIYKQGYLALDTGARNASEHQRNYRHQSVAHNSLLIRMPGEVLVCLERRPVAANSGGQNRDSTYARVLAFESDPLYAYTATDATPTYNEEKCARVVRQFLYLPPDHFVVFDRVIAKKAEYPKTWLLHTANEPAITGKEFRADQDRGRLFCRTLWPLDAALEKIGGPGKEFWADGRNWPVVDPSPAPGSGTWWKLYGRGHTEPPEAMGRWRVEVKPGAAREEDCFLHLIQASDQTVERMVESRVDENGERIELTFAANGRAYALALNKTGAVGGHIRIAEGERVRVDRALTRSVMPQSDLALTP
ncbi:MAG: heparinase II/III family protein [Armatimonadetes bacterium]|nr:heparinase II/III family protein [Armatimonadota bacterium]